MGRQSNKNNKKVKKVMTNHNIEEPKTEEPLPRDVPVVIAGKGPKQPYVNHYGQRRITPISAKQLA